MALPCQAKTIYVDANGTTDFNNIQAAINDANNGDTVIVADGIYTGQGNRNISFLGKAITLRSENGPETCIIDVNLPDFETYPFDPYGHRGFYFHQAEGANSVLQGFTIINGCVTGSELPPYGPNDPTLWPIGAGIFCRTASPTIINCVIRHCATEVGGGIGCMSAAPVIVNCTVTNCHAGGLGYCKSGGFGGGIGLIEGCNAKITNCTITNNSLWFNSVGGGIYCYNSNAEISRCIISGNGAKGSIAGGGICSSGPKSNMIVDNCTISHNTAVCGGGIICGEGSLTITNCIMWDDIPEEIYVTSGTPVITYSNVEGGWSGTGNINIDPCFADPCNGDYHLRSQAGRWEPNSERWILDGVTSPCIDAGNPGCPEANEPVPNGNRRNMGAYGGTAEASKSTANWRSIADLTNDWVVDSNDLKVFVDYWLEAGKCIPSDLDRSQFVDFNDFAIFGWHWSYPSASKPGITYQIEQCDPNSFRPFATEQAIETRFTVTVEGRYFHFKDTMVANCCSDKLELQMVVEDDLITIYEIEYLGAPCFCICDYPVTATLGPFQPGIYTLEVYEDWGGFIGSTIVVIGLPE